MLRSLIDEMNSPANPPSFYLELALKNFGNLALRQIYFVSAKMSVKKFYPERFEEVELLRSEKLTEKELKELAGLYQRLDEKRGLKVEKSLLANLSAPM